MPRESVCVRIPKTHGEKAIVLANGLKIVDKELEIQRDEDFIYIPFLREPKEKEKGKSE
jgi:tRNA G37 N-methylase Trm5